MERIIKSLLENDMYKFSMGQAIYHEFPDYMTTWTFKCRNEEVKFTVPMVDEIKHQVKEYCNLRFTEDELSYLNNIKWIKGSYVNFLRLWHPNYDDITITSTGDKGLEIETRGTWLNTSMYEVPILAIVNEVYFRYAYNYDELMFILGADGLPTFDNWNEYKYIIDNYHFLVMNRIGYNVDECMHRLNKTDYTVFNAHLVDVSSTYIREHLNEPELLKDKIDQKVIDILTNL